MKQIIPFDFDNTQIRTLQKEGEYWFVLRDVLTAMGSKTTTYSAQTSIHEGLGDGYVTSLPISDRLGRGQNALVVNEPAITYLVAVSRTEAGRRLNRFIHSDVLPAIRQQGHYAAEGSRLDTMMQRRTVGYRSLWNAYGTDRPPTSDLLQRLMTSFDKLAQDSGLPSQFEGVSPNPEMYLMTPALARHLIEAYCIGKQNGGRKAERGPEVAAGGTINATSSHRILRESTAYLLRGVRSHKRFNKCELALTLTTLAGRV